MAFFSLSGRERKYNHTKISRIVSPALIQNISQKSENSHHRSTQRLMKNSHSKNQIAKKVIIEKMFAFMILTSLKLCSCICFLFSSTRSDCNNNRCHNCRKSACYLGSYGLNSCGLFNSFCY